MIEFDASILYPREHYIKQLADTFIVGSDSNIMVKKLGKIVEDKRNGS